jgi:pimeloyl-ACP methyl ester carboxylesterase
MNETQNGSCACLNNNERNMVYFLSGLGADERVFKYLKLGGLSYKHIKWETPLKREGFTDYCKRLIAQIDLSEEVILVGVSFGGIVAQEISKFVNTKLIIILSSVKSVKEFDWQLAMVRSLRLYKLAPSRFLKWSNRLTGDYFFSVKTRAESELLKNIINDTDRLFIKWAIEAIMTWEGNATNCRLVHIHGDRDKIFPATRTKNFITITDGGHFMIVNRADEISEIIRAEIEKLK